MNYFNKLTNLINNYVIARITNRPSTAQFWYLPEPTTLNSTVDLERYSAMNVSPPYFIDYREKLNFKLENNEGIIVLPYEKPVGQQINPEAAFQYALGLHDQFYLTQNQIFKERFFKYVNFFLEKQTSTGLWHYDFDWFNAKAPWSSALAQARGASVMLRAWLLTKDVKYKNAAKKALALFLVTTSCGGFLHTFEQANCLYFEEYPEMPTGVINGFMAALICIWELKFWLKESELIELWELGLNSLLKMLPFYTTGWWSLYDLDKNTPIANVNSPRYHLLEMHYIKTLSLLADSSVLNKEYLKRSKQYQNKWWYLKALGMKILRKLTYK